MTAQLPLGWAECSLGDVVSLSREQVDPTQIPSTTYLSLEHIESGTNRILDRGVSGDIKSAKSTFSSGDVLYGKLRPYLKKVCMPDFDGVCSTDIFVLQETSALINELLLKYLSQDSFSEYATLNSKGINLPRLNFSEFEKHPFRLPPLPEQRRIVAKIKALQERSDRARAALTAVPPLLEKFRQSVLAAAFRGDLTREWREKNPHTEPASVLLTRIRAERRRRWEEAERAKMRPRGQEPKGNAWKQKYQEPEPVDATDLPELPEGWIWTIPEEIADCSLGKMLDRAKHQTGLQLPYLRNINVRWGKVDTSDLSTMFFRDDERDRYSINVGDVLVCEGGEPGRAAVWEESSGQMMYQKAIHRVRPYGDILPEWFVFHLWLDAESGDLQEHYTGTTIKHFTGKALAKYPVRLAPLAEQAEIIRKLKSILSILEEQQESVQQMDSRCESLTQSILAKAFRGELVPQDPNDEPAAALLARIRAERERMQAEGKTRPRRAPATRRAHPRES